MEVRQKRFAPDQYVVLCEVRNDQKDGLSAYVDRKHDDTDFIDYWYCHRHGYSLSVNAKRERREKACVDIQAVIAFLEMDDAA